MSDKSLLVNINDVGDIVISIGNEEVVMGRKEVDIFIGTLKCAQNDSDSIKEIIVRIEPIKKRYGQNGINLIDEFNKI